MLFKKNIHLVYAQIHAFWCNLCFMHLLAFVRVLNTHIHLNVYNMKGLNYTSYNLRRNNCSSQFGVVTSHFKVYIYI